jgi:hypothetical protein
MASQPENEYRRIRKPVKIKSLYELVLDYLWKHIDLYDIVNMCPSEIFALTDVLPSSFLVVSDFRIQLPYKDQILARQHIHEIFGICS